MIVRYLDVVLVVVALPVALALGAPALGCAVGSGAWIVQRILAQADRRWIRNTTEPRTQLGLNLFEAFGRIWLLAGAIVAAALIGGRVDGLAAAVTVFAAYTVAFAIRVLSGPPSASPTGSTESSGSAQSIARSARSAQSTQSGRPAPRQEVVR
ncbi:MAG TPA: hypothetical protein VME01_11125 [Solirubrobacteraceae bacterium]|nr:hypothetical protein [Solirubrobacteraceae bacterium]